MIPRFIFPLLFFAILTPVSPRTPDETSPPTDPHPIYKSIPDSQDQHPSLQSSSVGGVHGPAHKTASSDGDASTGCFHRERDACPGVDEKCRCKKLANFSSEVVCCDVNQFLLIEGLGCANVGITDEVTKLHIRNVSMTELNISLTQFRRLKSLSITDGRIQRLTGMFLTLTPIQCFNLSNNGLEAIEKRGITRLRHLNTLDLSHNNLTAVPNLNQDANISLDISGNNNMPCQSLLKARNNYTNLDFLNVNKTYCSISKTFHWFNSTEQLPLKQVEEYFSAQRNCWPNCTCEFYRMDYVQGKLPTIAFKVDCSGKQLTEMPGELPKNTIVLNISNNNISVLKMDNDSFGNIRELYADNNQITSILSLEGTKFLDNFVALSLRNNSLKNLPSYMLSLMFDRNVNSRQVHFGQNQLHCDCNTAKFLKVWLKAKEKNILDYKEIYCENCHLPVIQLNLADMCQDQKQTWTDYIYYIITAEVFLLVFLVLKVSYDYWVFKTAGYLPWPANKMPKLPCDWLCE